MVQFTVAVEGKIWDNDKFLLIKRKNHPNKGKWSFPGGRIHLNESLLGSCVREIKEETGLIVKPLDIAHMFILKFFDEADKLNKITSDIIFDCVIVGGKIDASINKEAVSYGWFNVTPDNFVYDLSEKIKIIECRDV